MLPVLQIKDLVYGTLNGQRSKSRKQAGHTTAFDKGTDHLKISRFAGAILTRHSLHSKQSSVTDPEADLADAGLIGREVRTVSV